MRLGAGSDAPCFSNDACLVSTASGTVRLLGLGCGVSLLCLCTDSDAI